MSQRLLYNTKWLWCLLVMYTGSTWGQPRPITVRTPPSNPSTIEAQAKFFQDFFSVQLSPYKIEFGHVCEDPNTWEQRYEKQDFKNHRAMGKVRWGDKKGGYGEHYWDLNHAGHSGNHGDNGYEGDDGSYHDLSNDPYDEPSEHSPSYGNDDYDPEKLSYEETGRAKRHHPKVKLVKKHQKQPEIEEYKPQKDKRKNKEELEEAATHQDEEYEDEDEEEYYEKPKRHHKKQKENRHKKQEESEANQEQPPPKKEKNQFVLVVSHNDDSEKQNLQHQPQYAPQTQRQQEQPQYVPKQPELPQYLPNNQPEPQFVPYEGGAGVRQHQHPEVTAATTVPRLFLEPSTGHVVDRATGQAYVLQPIVAPKTYN